MANVLIVNGSLAGSGGNTAELLALAEEHLTQRGHTASYLELARDPHLDRILEAARAADAFIFGSGTYWDSWGSPLQRFLEVTASSEGDPAWMGKPVGAIVTAHAVGAKGVLSRLFGVLNVYGMLIPPYAGIVYTYAAQTALQSPNLPAKLSKELWQVEDVEVIVHNLLAVVNRTFEWHTWPYDNVGATDKWLTVYSDRDAP